MNYTTSNVYPVSLTETKNHLNIIGDADNSVLAVLISGATSYVEGITDQSLVGTAITATYESSDVTSGNSIELPSDYAYGESGHCYAVISDEETTELTWSLNDDKTAVIISDIPEAYENIIFEYQTSITISDRLRLAILTAIAFFYENRGDENGSKSEPVVAKLLALMERHSAL